MGKSVTQSGRKASRTVSERGWRSRRVHHGIGDRERAMTVSVFAGQLDPEIACGAEHGDLALGKAAGQLRVAGLDVRGSVAGNNDEQVVRLGVCQLAKLRDGFRKRFLKALEVVQKLRALLRFEERAIVVALLAREVADFGNAHDNDGQRGIDCQRLQLFGGEGGANVGEARQAQVGLVDAEGAHGFVVGDAREGHRQRDADGGESRGHESFDHGKDGFLLRERHLEVDLREFRLAIGAQIFIAEAADDLEILVHAGDHQDLLEELRRLRERVEIGRVHAAGHQIIARAFGRGAREERRLDLVEALRGKVFAYGKRDFVANLEIVLHLRASQVEIAILEPHFFVGDCLFGRRKRWKLRVVQDQQVRRGDFDFAGDHFRVDRIGAAQADLADRGDDVFRAHVLGFGMAFGRKVLIQHNLRNAVAIAQVEEDEVAVIAPAIHPTHQRDGLAGVGGAQFAAGVSALSCA